MSRFENWSHSLRRTFVKDCSLPISVVKDPYFEHQINFLDKQYKTLEKVAFLESALSSFKNEDEFLKYMRTTREAVIDGVKGHSDYTKFGTLKIHPLNSVGFERKIPEKSVYKLDNVGFRMVSVDLVSANFQVFRLFFPDLVNGTNTYDEFVSQFSDLPYFKQSKKIRQIIFGNLNPKRQMRITKDIMMTIAGHLIHNFDLDMRMLSADEIVFREVKDLKPFTIPEIEGSLSKMEFDGKQVASKVEEFTLEQVGMKTSKTFIKNTTFFP